MKLFYYAAAAAAMASAVFCSCDKQDEVTPPQPEIAPVQFVGVTALDVVTRAEAKPYAADFNVFIPGVTAATKLVKFSADAWTVDGDPILVDRKGGTLVAWAPSALAVTTSASGAEYTLTAQKDAAAQDLIYQPQPVNAANANAVAVEMKHAYSKLSFLATAGSGYTGAANLTQVQITGGIHATGTLDMVAGTVDPAGTATGTLTLAAGEKALVVPMAGQPTIAVTCTIDGKEFTATIKADTMPSLLAGVEYEITLTVVGQEAVISSVKEVPWTTTKVDGGTIF
jgi:hypothetical protein|nr:fimbrillin family protein [Alistipes onderdonkii]